VGQDAVKRFESDVEVRETGSVFAVQNGSGQDVLKPDEKRRSIGVQEEGSHLDGIGRMQIVMK
jgi:hypothetical protein